MTSVDLGEQRQLTAHPGLPVFFVSLVVAGLVAWLALTVMSSNVDVSWLIVAGERWLEGAALHTELVETNPPFSIWIYLPMLIAEGVTGIKAETWVGVAIPMLALVSATLAARILLRAGWFTAAWAAWLLPVAVWLLAWFLPAQFGQREHVATLALLPWLALLAARGSSPGFQAGTFWQIVIAGLGAATFVMMKPPMAVLTLAVPALWLAIAHRSLRPLLTPETLIGAAVTIAYLARILIYDQAFISDVLPSVAAYYLPIRQPLSQMLGNSYLIAFAVMLLVMFLLTRRIALDPAALVLLLAAAGCLPGFLLMGKGWPNHALPFLLFGLMAVLIQFARTPPRQAVLPALVMAVEVTSMTLASLGEQEVPPPALVQQIVQSAGDRPTVFSIATRLQPAHPLTRMVGGQYRSPGPSMWRAGNAEILARDESNPARRTEMLAQRDADIAAAAAEIHKLQPDVVIAGGEFQLPAEAAIIGDPAMIRALEPYRVIHRDAGSTIYIRSRP